MEETPVYILENPFKKDGIVELSIKHIKKQWFCGYVEFNNKSELYKTLEIEFKDKSLDDYKIEVMIGSHVHGGITYSAWNEEKNTIVIGFDCNHLIDEKYPKSQSYCARETYRLATDVAKFNPLKYLHNCIFEKEIELMRYKEKCLDAFPLLEKLV